MDLMGGDALHSEEAMLRMWGDSIRAVKCQHARITYDDFLLLMKGQSRDDPIWVGGGAGQQRLPLHVLPESEMEDSGEANPQENALLFPEDVTITEGSILEPTSPLPMPLIADLAGTPTLAFRATSPSIQNTQSAPSTPADHKRILEIDELDSPPSMDEDADILSAGPGIPGSAASLTPPQSPVRGARDYVTPMNANRFTVSLPSNANNIFVPGLPPRPEPYTRRRSRSEGGDEAEEGGTESSYLHNLADAVRDMILPETDHVHTKHLDSVVKDGKKSTLMVNRQLYRAHRQMRLAVLDASKRFEEQQTAHAREVILAQREAEGKTDGLGMIQAGLVMRHGHKKQVSSEAIRKLLQENRVQQQALVEKANRRGGRGRRSRKKTISDMSGMLSSMGADELGGIASAAAMMNANEPPLLQAAKTFGDKFDLPNEPVVVVVVPEEIPTEGHLRSATVPGQFRTTRDPFSKEGKYGSIHAAWEVQK